VSDPASRSGGKPSVERSECRMRRSCFIVHSEWVRPLPLESAARRSSHGVAPYGQTRRRSCPPIKTGSGSFTGFRFPPEVILLAGRWYLRYGLSYRDLEELLAERGMGVDHVTLYRWCSGSLR
jgi:hypothetical protein